MLAYIVGSALGGALFGVTVFFCVVLFIVLKTFIIVPARSNVVQERFGKFVKILKPGFHFLVPFIDRPAYTHEMREQVINVPSQSCITKDNIQVEVDGIVYLKVMDAEKASYGISDYRLASINLAQTTMRSEIGKLTLHHSFSERGSLNEKIVREIDVASDPWGIKVLRYEIRDITPSSNVQHTLEKQMVAERDKRAEITLATADKESKINVSRGQRQEAINISEGEKQKRINQAEGRAQEIKLLADASAQGIQMVADAMSAPGGDKAMKMQIVEKYIEQYGKILQNAEVSVVPSELANIKGFFEGIGRVSEKMS